MKKISLLFIFSCCLLINGCDSVNDKLEELAYYKSQYELYKSRYDQAQQALNQAKQELNQAYSEIDRLRSEVERTKNLHKRMLE